MGLFEAAQAANQRRAEREEALRAELAENLAALRELAHEFAGACRRAAVESNTVLLVPQQGLTLRPPNFTLLGRGWLVPIGEGELDPGRIVLEDGTVRYEPVSHLDMERVQRQLGKRKAAKLDWTDRIYYLRPGQPHLLDPKKARDQFLVFLQRHVR